MIITTDLEADALLEKTAKTTISEGRVYNFSYQGKELTFINSRGTGPPTGDIVLALSCTPCRYLVYTGTCCGLSWDIKTGDLMLITEAIGGDGYTRFLENGELSPHLILMPAVPDPRLNYLLDEYATIISTTCKIPFHKSRAFSSDSIIAEMVHPEQITGWLGCTGLEMETSAVFNAAAAVGIQAAAILIASDASMADRLFPGGDMEKQKYISINQMVLSRIILNTLCDERLYRI